MALSHTRAEACSERQSPMEKAEADAGAAPLAALPALRLGPPLQPATLLALQQTVGNRAVQARLARFAPPASAATLQRRTSQEIVTNVVDLTTRRGSAQLDQRSVERVQRRLIELGCLHENAPGFAWGQMTEATRAGLVEFQRRYAADIEQIRADSQRMDALDGAAGPRRGQDGARFQAGQIGLNDATHQALANAWPRHFFGVLIPSQEKAFALLMQIVRSRSLPFDPERVNVVGVRGYQGGGEHDNAGARLRANRYDDTFFLLARDQEGRPQLREFRGTTDPGGRSSARGREDANTHMLGADQQFTYQFRYAPSAKFNRPMLAPITGEGDERLVIDPRRAEIEAREGPLEREARRGRSQSARLAADAGPHHRYDRVRTEHGSRGHMAKAHGIAMHSGGGADEVFADSTGCQVIHGDWYGNYIESLRRALTWERLRTGLPVPASADRLVEEGQILYSLIDGRDVAPLARQLLGSAEEATR